MTQDAKRRPGQEPPRHAVGITRTCLASGSMQLPFALAGALPQGELLVHDTESGEALILWSDPPRRLAGLAPFFDRHDLQVNDSVVLELDGDEVRLTATKRPRRSRPVVQPSTWTSLHDEPGAAPRPHPDVPRVSDDPASGDTAGRNTARRDAARDDAPDHGGGRDDASEPASAARTVPQADSPIDSPMDSPADSPAPAARPASTQAPSSRSAPRWGDGSSAEDWRDDEPSSTRDQDSFDAFEMPSAPAVVVRPADEATTRSGRPLSRSESMPSRGGAFAGLRRVARSWFGGGSASSDDQDDSAPAEAPDWTRGWDAEEDDVVPTPAFTQGRTPTPSPKTQRSTPAVENPIPERPPGSDAPEIDDDDEPVTATPLFPEATPPRGPVRRPVDETPSGVPARAERFLGGDLRTRLLRYLASPEMGSIAHTERIAKRFDLDETTAASLLSDIADDPPDGLRLREVRSGAWRIERTLGR